MQPGTLHLLHAVSSLVLVRRDDLLHLLRRDCEAGAGRPDAIAFGVEDRGAVDVAGAHEGLIDVGCEGQVRQ